MPQRFQAKPRTWRKKFGDAFAAIGKGVRGQNSFYAHFTITGVVIALSVWLQLDRIEWCLLVICVFVVLCAEMFNRSLEIISRAVTRNYSKDLEVGLNVASGAVLIAAIGASTTGLLVLIPKLIDRLGAS